MGSTSSQWATTRLLQCLVLILQLMAMSRSQSTKDLRRLDELLEHYDRRLTPTSKNGRPTEVSCELFIRSFGAFDPEKMDYEADVYVRQWWHDSRLITTNSSIRHPGHRKQEEDHMDLSDTRLVRKLWRPDIYFPNAKDGNFQIVTTTNILLRLYPTGKVLYILRLRLKFSCMMDLRRYPLDSQVCPIELANFARTKKETDLKWRGSNAVQLYKNVKLARFIVEDVRLQNCEGSFHIDEYGCLKVELVLRRSISYYLIQKYIPSMLIVAVSWLSFWLDRDSIPGRVTIGITTLLTITQSDDHVDKLTPDVSYVTALDLWTGACTTFVFLALLEFTVVNYVARHSHPMLKKDLRAAKLAKQDAVTFYKRQKLASNIDHICRILFPATFLIFNIIYWSAYLS